MTSATKCFKLNGHKLERIVQMSRFMHAAGVVQWVFGLGLSLLLAWPAQAANAQAACPALLQHNVLRLQDEKPQSL